MKGGSSRIAPVVAVLAVLLLVGIVAVAATGSTSAGTSEGRRPSETLLDTFFTLVLLMFIPAAAIFVYGLMQRKDIAREVASGRYRRTGIADVPRVPARCSQRSCTSASKAGTRSSAARGRGRVQAGGSRRTTRCRSRRRLVRAEFTWIPVADRRSRSQRPGSSRSCSRPAPARPAVAEDEASPTRSQTRWRTRLDDLRAEPDPRRKAVIAAYARLERVLAAAGRPRQLTETAEEYVVRILDRLEVDRRRGPNAHRSLLAGEVLAPRGRRRDEGGGDRGARAGPGRAARGRTAQATGAGRARPRAHERGGAS